MDQQQKWEKQARKIVFGLRKGVLIYCILVMALLFLYNLGILEKVDKFLPAAVAAEDGGSYTCDIRIIGEATRYPVKEFLCGHSYRGSGEVTVYANGQRLAIVSLDGGDPDHAGGYNYPATCVLRRDLESAFAETDVQRVFPEQESQRCIIVAPACNAEGAIALLKKQGLPEAWQTAFQWALQ